MLLYSIILFRLIIPLLIFRYPFRGFVAAMVADAIDYELLKLFGWNNFSEYQLMDKILDLYLLFIGAWVSQQWLNQLARRTSLFLVVHRFIGVFLFEALNYRKLLLFFPDLFSWFYLGYLGFIKIFKIDPIVTKGNLAGFLFMLLVPKLIQEYILHFAQLEWWTWFPFSILN